MKYPSMWFTPCYYNVETKIGRVGGGWVGLGRGRSGRVDGGGVGRGGGGRVGGVIRLSF